MTIWLTVVNTFIFLSGKVYTSFNLQFTVSVIRSQANPSCAAFRTVTVDQVSKFIRGRPSKHCDLESSDSAVRMSTGIKFHTDGAAERKAREPITVLIRGTVRFPDSDYLKRHSETYGVILDARQDG